MLKITVDTNAIDASARKRMKKACSDAAVEVEIAHTTVTDREIEGTSLAVAPGALLETGVWNESRWGKSVWGGSIPETMIIGESRIGQAALGEEMSVPRFQAILDVVGNGSFPPPGKRDNLTKGERNQLRDAMILETHARERRDVLVSDDQRGFIRHGKRQKLEAICRTRIMTVDEFCEFVVKADDV